MSLTNRLATAADETALSTLMTLAIEQLQSAYLTAAQVQASHGFMGLDRRLIGDRTYFVVEAEGAGEMRDADAGEGADDGAATGASPAERSMIASSGFMGAV